MWQSGLPFAFQLVVQSDRALNAKQGSLEGEGQAWAQGGQTLTWPFGAADWKVAITVVSHLGAGPGVAPFYKWAGNLPTCLFALEPRSLGYLGGELHHACSHCPTWPLQEEFSGDPVSDTPRAEPWKCPHHHQHQPCSAYQP